jgi:hypothetical protein
VFFTPEVVLNMTFSIKLPLHVNYVNNNKAQHGKEIIECCILHVSQHKVLKFRLFLRNTVYIKIVKIKHGMETFQLKLSMKVYSDEPQAACTFSFLRLLLHSIKLPQNIYKFPNGSLSERKYSFLVSFLILCT